LAALLAAPLADRDLPGPARTFVCRQLAAIGGAAEVPTLAAMLDDPARAEDARYALEAIADSAAGQALRAALGRLKGPTLVGVAHSLGQRRDPEAVDSLAALVAGPDPLAVATALVALGRIGTPAAAAALTRAPASREQARARLECADRLARDGHPAAARAICLELVPTAPTPGDRLAALTVLSRVGPAEALPLLVNGLADADPLVSAGSIRLVGALAVPAATQALAESLAGLSPYLQAIALESLAERGDRSVRPAVRALLAAAEASVRAAALGALGTLGQAEDVPDLLRAAAEGDGTLRGAAAEALARLTAEGVDGAILQQAGTGTPPLRVAAFEAAAARRSPGLEATLDQALADTEEAVRLAAVRVLGRNGGAAAYPKLIATLAPALQPALRTETERALIAVGRRLADEPARVGPIATTLAVPGTHPEVAASLLRVLGGFGGPAALAAVRSRIADPEATVREAAVRALAEWPDPAAVPDLCALVGEAQTPVHRALLLRAALRLAPKSEAPMARLEQLRVLLQTADERRLWLSAVAEVPAPEALAAALSLLGDGEVLAEAAVAATRIGTALAKQHPALVEEAMAKVAAVAPEAQAATVRALQVEAGGIQAARRLSAEQRQARLAALAKDLPAGWAVTGYLDCGVDTEDAPQGGPALRVANGQTWLWEGSAQVGDLAAATVAFEGSQVLVDLSGLAPDRPYRLGFTWWDYDNNGRRQSVWAGGRQLLRVTELPAWIGKQQPAAQLAVDLPVELTAAASVRIAFRREAATNAVVSEVWLLSGPAGSVTPKPKETPVKKVLIQTGRDYPGHAWAQTAPVLRDAIAQDGRLAVTISEDPRTLGSPELRGYDAIVLHYMNWEDPGPGPEAQENFRRTVEAGTGLVLVHFACGAFQGWPEFVRLAGRIWDPKLRGHDPHGAFTVNIIDRTHPVTAALESFETTDELYTCLTGETPIQILATARSKVDGKDYPMAFTLTYGKGHVLHCVLGHDVNALANPAVGRLFRRASAWTAGLEPGE
jgi:HEAT repeat protein/type 1 glutamine amidotransferase